MNEQEFRYGGVGKGTTEGGSQVRPSREFAESAKVPFQRHDARNTVAGRPTSALESLRLRIDRISAEVSEGLHGVAGHMEEHADRVHGVQPPPPPQTANRVSGGVEEAEPFYGEGQLGDLFRSVGNLEHSLNVAARRVAEAAGRNTTLA